MPADEQREPQPPGPEQEEELRQRVDEQLRRVRVQDLLRQQSRFQNRAPPGRFHRHAKMAA